MENLLALLPEIINTDQGSQVTVDEFVEIVEDRGCRLSMDGRGAWRDTVFIERVWKSVKDARVFLYDCNSVNKARQSIMHFLVRYNRSRKYPGDLSLCQLSGSA